MSSIPQVGARIAGYKIEKVLEVGGMSIVYLAEHVGLERKVAFKVLTPELSADERFRQRFIRESRLAVSIDHPNIIPVYDAGEADGVLYIAMLYVQGINLKDLILRVGYLDTDRLVSIIMAVASALDAAHARGLVHRDVKPGNILLASHGTGGIDHIYLSDFGLTKRAASRSGLTDTGQFAGTVDYVAPEQVEGHDIDGRADVYSLGCVVHECLTGKVPFEKDNQVAVLWSHMQDPPPRVTDVRADLPPAVDAVITKAMAKSREDRYPKAGDMAEALKRALSAPRETSTPSFLPTASPPGPVTRWAEPPPAPLPPPPPAAAPSTGSDLIEAPPGRPEREDQTRPPHRTRQFRPAILVPVVILLIGGLLVAGYLIGRSSRGAATAAGPSPKAGTGGGALPASQGCKDINSNPVAVGGSLLADGTLTCLLAKHVPADIRQHCIPLDGKNNEGQLPLAGAARQPPATDVFLRCSVPFAGNTFTAWYLFKHDRDEVGLDYKAILAANGIAINEGPANPVCRTAPRIERRWYVAAQEPLAATTTTTHVFDKAQAEARSKFYPNYGRFACWTDQQANEWMAWTDANLTVLTVAENLSGGSWDKFESWWRFRAGPGHPPSA